MNIGEIIATNVAYLAALSMAAERLVEIMRAIPWFTLAKGPVTGDDAGAKREAVRVASVNILAIVAGVITAAFAYNIGTLPATKWSEVFIYGVLAGAGSGFWNAVLSYMLQVKNLKKEQVLATAGGQEATVQMKVARARAGALVT